MASRLRLYGTVDYPRGVEVLVSTVERPDMVIGSVMVSWEEITRPAFQEHIFKACAKRLRDAWEQDNPLPLWED